MSRKVCRRYSLQLIRAICLGLQPHFLHEMSYTIWEIFSTSRANLAGHLKGETRAVFVKELEDKNTYDVSIQLSIDGRVSYRGK